jgi:hypothetical protein
MSSGNRNSNVISFREVNLQQHIYDGCLRAKETIDGYNSSDNPKWTMSIVPRDTSYSIDRHDGAISIIHTNIQYRSHRPTGNRCISWTSSGPLFSTIIEIRILDRCLLLIHAKTCLTRWMLINNENISRNASTIHLITTE